MFGVEEMLTGLHEMTGIHLKITNEKLSDGGLETDPVGPENFFQTGRGWEGNHLQAYEECGDLHVLRE